MTNNNLLVLVAYNKGYRVDVHGNVISPTGKILKLKITKSLYLKFKVYHDCKRQYCMVHKLQAYCKYKDEMFNDSIVVRHLNGNPSDNSYDNISVGSYSDNMMDIPKDVRLEKSINASTTVRKFSDSVMNEIRDKRSNGWSYNDLMDEYDISSKGTLSYIINNKYKTKV